MSEYVYVIVYNNNKKSDGVLDWIDYEKEEACVTVGDNKQILKFNEFEMVFA